MLQYSAPVLALTHRSSSSSVSPTLFTHSLSSLAAIERLCAAPLKRAGAGQLSLALCRRSSSSETVLLQCCSAQLSWDQSEEDARPWRTHSGFAKLVPSLVTAKSGQFFGMRRALANWILFQNCSLLRTSDRVGRPFFRWTQVHFAFFQSLLFLLPSCRPSSAVIALINEHVTLNAALLVLQTSL